LIGKLPAEKAATHRIRLKATAIRLDEK